MRLASDVHLHPRTLWSSLQQDRNTRCLYWLDDSGVLRRVDLVRPLVEGSSMECPFCSLPANRVITKTVGGTVIRDAYPVSPGHTLIIPVRHVGSFFALTSDEQRHVLELLDWAREQLDAEFHPDAYNIGINDGVAAGQTIPHVHVHLLPRYRGDCADPRGGIRWTMPAKADYWTSRESS